LKPEESASLPGNTTKEAELKSTEGRTCEKPSKRSTGEWKMDCDLSDDEKEGKVWEKMPDCNGKSVAQLSITTTTTSTALETTTTVATTTTVTTTATTTSINGTANAPADAPNNLHVASGSYEPMAWAIIGAGSLSFLTGLAILIRSLAAPPPSQANRPAPPQQASRAEQEGGAVEFENFRQPAQNFQGGEASQGLGDFSASRGLGDFSASRGLGDFSASRGLGDFSSPPAGFASQQGGFSSQPGYQQF
jgi:hypothetical protein